MERNIRLTVEYDGAPYQGWQRQPGHPTVQGVLESKLSVLCGHAVSLRVAGRTDAGVHALGQVCNFHTTSRLPVARLFRVINQLLPHSVRVTRLREAPAVFHSTYHARAKLYRYVIRNARDYTVFDRGMYHHVRLPLSLSAMRAAARCLTGKRDFSSFCGISGRDRDPVRDLKRITVRRKGPWIRLDFYGVSFLHQMVRILAGTLLYAGLGKFKPGDIPRILAARDRKASGPTLPPNGLFLVRVDYPSVLKPVRARGRSSPLSKDEGA